ncbi:MAG: SRPBCC family protein [Chlorobium sp.]|nr:SRPBCC family protein [Chlorobium sp.]
MGIPIRSADETFIPLSPAEIWPVLADIARYPNWWPQSLFVRLLHVEPGFVGSEFAIRPYGWRSFRCRVVSFEESVRISLQYDGVYMRGVAEWRLEPVGQGTKIIYDMDAEVNDSLVALVGKVIDLKSIHSYSMRKIFRNLQEQL